MRSPTEMEMRLVKALFNSLEHRGPGAFIGDFEIGTSVAVDGHFDLLGIVRDVIREMREPTPEIYAILNAMGMDVARDRAANGFPGSWWRNGNLRERWAAMIDAASPPDRSENDE